MTSICKNKKQEHIPIQKKICSDMNATKEKQEHIPLEEAIVELKQENTSLEHGDPVPR
jgi:hypothetical protein